MKKHNKRITLFLALIMIFQVASPVLSNIAFGELFDGLSVMGDVYEEEMEGALEYTVFGSDSLADWITKFEMKINGEEAVEGMEIDLDGVNSVMLNYEFSIPDGVTITPNQEYKLQLPKGFKVPEDELNNQKAVPFFMGNEKVGESTLNSDSTVSMIFDNKINDFDIKKLNLNFDLEIDNSAFEEDGEVKINIPYSEEHGYTLILKAKPTEIEGEDKKTGYTFVIEDGKEKKTTDRPTHAGWKILINDSYKKYTSAKLVDTLGEGQTLDMDSFKITRITKNRDGSFKDSEDITYSYKEKIQKTTDGFEIDFGPIEHTYEIEYVTELEPKVNGTSDITNNAKLVLDSDENGLVESIQVKWGKDNPAIQKTGSLVNGSKDLIQWEVWYNFNGDDVGDSITLTDTLSHGYIIEETIEVYTTEVDIDGKPVQGTKNPVSDGIVKNLTESNSKLQLTLSNLNKKPLIIRYQSKVPANTIGKVSNSITDGKVDKPATESVNVNTTVQKSKVGEQKVDDKGIPYIEWTITVNDDKFELTTIVIDDTFDGTLLELVTNSFKLKKTGKVGESVIATIPEASISTKQNGGFTYTINPAGEYKYELTYRTNYTDTGLIVSDVTNDVTITTDGSGGGVTTQPVNGPKPGISKSGSYDSENKDITKDFINWTVTFNQNKLKLIEPTIRDTFIPNTLKLIDEPLIEVGKNTLIKGADYTLEKLEDDTSESGYVGGFIIKFKGNTEPAQYTMTYKTTVDYNQNSIKPKNIVTITDEKGITDTTSEELPIREPGLKKSGTQRALEDGTKINDWIITINENRYVVYDLVITDTYTPKEVDIIGGISGIKVYEDDIELANPNNSLYTITTPEQGKFVITFKQPTKRAEYTIKYSTSYPNEVQKHDAVNKVDITYNGSGKDDNRTATITRPTLKVDKSASLNKTVRPHVIQWKVQANTDKENKYVYLVDAVLEDTIEADQRYKKDSLELYYGKRVGNNLEADLSSKIELTDANLSWEDNKFTIKLPDGLNEFVLLYETEIISYPPLDPAKGYHNKVTLKNQTMASIESGLRDEASDDAWVKLFSGSDNNNPSKSGYQDPLTDDIIWEAVINGAALPIRNAKVYDYLDENQIFIEDGIEIYALINGEEIFIGKSFYDISFDEKEGKAMFTIELKENEAIGEVEGGISFTYKLKYKSILKDSVNGRETVSNTIQVVGKTGNIIDEGTSGGSKVEKWNFGGSGSGIQAYLEIEKVDYDKVSKKLPGVKFELYRVVADNEVRIGETLETDSHGYLKFDKIRSGRYLLKEVDPNPYYSEIEDIKLTIRYDNNDNPLVSLDDGDWNSNSPYTEAHGAKLTVKNKLKVDAPALMDILVSKTWDDDNDRDRKRPESITINLLANGNLISSKQITKEDGWKYEFINLPKFEETDNSKEIIYTITENSVKEYSTEIAGSVIEGFNVINRYTPGKTSVTVTKAWDDNGDYLGIRPNAILIQLLADGEILGSPIELNASNKWTKTWGDLPEKSVGLAIIYTVDEISKVENYETSVNDDDIGNIIITNTYISPKDANAKAYKVWNDDSETKPTIWFKLFRFIFGGEKEEVPVLEAPIKELVNGVKEVEWTNLTRTDRLGRQYFFSVKEVNQVGEDYIPESFTNIISEDGLTITNIKIRGSLSITKVARGSNRPLKGAEFTLYSDAEGKNVVAGPIASDENGKLVFEDLEYGTYYYGETKAPAGYYRNKDILEVKIENHEEVVEVTVQNTVISDPGGGGGGGPEPDPKPPVKPPTEEPKPPVEPEKPTDPDQPEEVEEEVPEGSIPTIKNPPENGSVTIDENGKWTYTPNPGFTGKDKFTITVKHPDGTEEDIIIEIDVDVPLGTIDVGVDEEQKPTLPKTGKESMWIYPLLGILMVGLGLKIRKTKDGFN